MVFFSEIQEKKDAQLTQYIEFLNNSTQQLIAQAIKPQEARPVEPDHHEAEIIDAEEEPEPVELMQYLKDQKFNKDYRKQIKERAKKALVKDSRRFAIINEKIYIFPNLHKYNDIF